MNMHVIVTGKVQGVFYRDFCKEHADRLDLKGWARNNPDGTVEAIFQGTDEALSEMRRLLHEGPPSSRVDGVVARRIDGEETFDSFEVKY